MDPAILGAVSALFGSVVGGTASLTTAWVTQNAQSKRELLATELRKREALYGEFVTECTKLMIDAVDHTLDSPATLLASIAVLNRIRLTASDPVLAASEAAINAIVEGYFRDKVSLLELTTQVRDGTRAFPDPLAAFSAVCRVELQSLHRIK